MADPIKLVFKPGINREVTEYTAMGGYVDGNLVRFVKGFPQSIGGWRRLTTEPSIGTPRGLFPLVTLDGQRLYGMGTTDKYYIINGTELNDVTPLRASVTLGLDPFTTTLGSNIVTVEHVAHGALVGDYVTFSGATDTGGLLAAALNTEFTVASVVDADNYTIVVAGDAATSGASGGGSVVLAEYQIPIGINSTVLGFGWGTGPFGEGAFGEPSEPEITGQLRLWSQDKFGEDLVANIRDGAIYYFDNPADVAERMVALSTLTGANQVPVICRQIILSDNDRHLIALGCNGYSDSVLDPLLIRWCDRENAPEWGVSTTTTAGSLRVDTGSEIVCGVKLAGAIIVFTDASLHTLRYTGSPFAFGQVKEADNVHIIGPNAAVAIGSDLYFMGISKFHLFNGAVSEIPCDVEGYVFDRINFDERSKIVVGYNSLYGEITWHLPVDGSSEVNFYVIYNILDGTWAYGRYGALGRTGWLDVLYEKYPLATAPDGYVYLHDIGATDGSVEPPGIIDSWVQAAPLEIGAGDDFMHVSKMIPDVDFDGSSASAPEVTITLDMRDAPGVAPRQSAQTRSIKAVNRLSSSPVQTHTAEIQPRIRGRSMIYKIASAAIGTLWRQGTHRLYAHPDGKR